MKKSILKYLLATLAIITILVIFLFLKETDAQNSEIYLQNKNYKVQLDLQSLYTTSSADIVMLGNSLTYNVNWSELLNRKTLIEV